MDSHEKRLKNFQNKKDKDLLMTIEMNSGTADADLASTVLQNKLKKSITKLRKTIDENNKKSTKQTNWLIGLTIAIAVLTFFMLIGLGIQIWPLLK